jgi:hypothetical protein
MPTKLTFFVCATRVNGISYLSVITQLGIILIHHVMSGYILNLTGAYLHQIYSTTPGRVANTA